MTNPYPKRRFVPQAVLTRFGKINTAGASVNTVARLVNTAGSKPTVNHPRPISNAYKKGYSQVTRPLNKYSVNKKSIFNKKVNTVRVNASTARDKAVLSGNKGKAANVVKASSCWIMMVDLFPLEMVKVEKALYGLHQAPRAWYETLSTYLLENGFRRGTIYKTLFIKKDKAYYAQEILDEFYRGAYFLLKITSATEGGWNLHQSRQVKDEEAEDVDVHLYRSMIRSLTYLTASRPNIMFIVCAYAMFQVTPKVSHLHAVKRIFRYLKSQPKLGLWYPRDSPFDLEAFSDSDYAGASLDRKSTIGGKSKEVRTLRYLSLVVPLKKVGDEALHKELGDRMERAATTASSLEVEQDSDAQTRFEAASKSPMIHLSQELPHLEVRRTIQALVDKKKVIVTEASIRCDLQLDDFEDKQVGDISTHTKTYDAPCHTKKVFGNMKRVGKDFSGRVTPLFPTMLVQAQEEVGEGSTNPIDPHHTPIDSQPLTSHPQQKHKSRKSKIKITEVPHPSDSTTKMRNMVKKLEKKVSKRTHKLKRLYKVGVIRKVQSSDDEGLGAQEDENDNLIFDASVFDSEEVVNTAEKEVSTADRVTTATLSITTTNIEVSTVVVITPIPNTSTIVTTIITPEEINLAQEITLAFATLKSIKPKVKDVISPTIATTTTTTTTIDTRPNARGVIVQEPTARFKIEEAERQEQANIDLINSSDNVQAMIEANQLLAERLLAREQVKLTEEQMASLFMQLLEKRRKFFAAKKAEAKRNKLPTQAQQRKLYCNYLKNMEGYTLKLLKGSEDKAKGSGKKTKDSRKKSIGKKRDAGKHDSESAKIAEIAQEKRTKNEQEQGSSKRQRMKDDKETKELKSALSLVLMMRNQLLSEFNREDLVNLWRLVKAKHGDNRPEEAFKRVL
ncbi:ribonuclease H-like domain-containing protein [Tanacetum coccineum]